MENQTLIEDLKTIRDEVKLHAHLLEMDLMDKFKDLENRFDQKIIKWAQEFGEFNEEFWVGNESEVKDLLENYKQIKEKTEEAVKNKQ